MENKRFQIMEVEEQPNVVLPEVLMDNEGYPSEEYLKFLREFKGGMPILDLVSVICDNWNHGDMGYKLHRKYKGKRKFELHTLGWSGNEDIINEIVGNLHLTFFYMEYYKWLVGGHYYFKIPIR